MFRLLDIYATNPKPRGTRSINDKTLYYFPRIKSNLEERFALANVLYELQAFCDKEYDVVVILSHQRFSQVYEYPFISDLWGYFFKAVILALREREQLEA
jgi:hypothetical protein